MTDRRRRVAGAAALLALLAPVLAPTASYSAPTVRADVSAGSQAAGSATRLSVTVRPAGTVQRGTVVVALPAGWPRPTRGTVGVDADGCTTGPARLAGAALQVSRVTCAAGASISLSVRGRLPVKAARYDFSTTLTGRLGGAGRTSQSVESSFTVVPAKAHHLVLTPPSATTTYGGTQAFRAFAEDAFGNRRGEVTDRASFSMSPDGSCSGAVCGDGAHAGAHVVTGALGELSGYADLTVEPRRVTVAAQPATRIYGARDPAFTYTVEGLVGASTTLAGVTCGVAGAHAGVGSYPITCSGASDPDYVVDGYLPSTLSVTAAPLTVRVAGTQTYGGAPAYTADIAGAGLVNGDTAAVVRGTLSCRTSATSTSGVGTYPITSCSGLSSPNYTIGYSYGTVRITPLAVTVRADGKTKVAGQPDPAFTYTTVPAGLRLAGVSCSVSPAHSATGVYPITCSTTTDANYSQTTVPGTLTVTPASLVIRVTGSQPYGGAPTYVPTVVSGLVNGDTSAVLRGSVTCRMPATATSAVGSYPITECSGLTATGYSIAYEYGSMQVTRKTLRVNVTGTQVYGGSPGYTRTVVAADLVNGDTADVVTGALACVTSASAASDVGTYLISSCSGLSAADYALEYDLGAVEVTPKSVTVRADDKSKNAGALDPAFTYSTVPAGVTLTGVTCSVAGPHDAAGSYDITCSTTTDPNYDQTTVTGSLTVAAVCGNGVPEAPEACDDGNAVTESGTCPYGDATCAPACTATCDAVVPRSSGGWCGDAVTQPGEACDDGNTTTETACPYGSRSCTACNSTCSASLSLTGGYCGDAVTQPGETCDDGNTTTETSCPYGQATCSVCNATCTEQQALTGAVCGNTVIEPGEACDDGNQLTETACSYGTRACSACDAGCTSTLSLTGGYCGDNRVSDGEACDDGNTSDGDGCSAICQVGPG